MVRFRKGLRKVAGQVELLISLAPPSRSPDRRLTVQRRKENPGTAHTGLLEFTHRDNRIRRITPRVAPMQGGSALLSQLVLSR